MCVAATHPQDSTASSTATLQQYQGKYVPPETAPIATNSADNTLYTVSHGFNRQMLQLLRVTFGQQGELGLNQLQHSAAEYRILGDTTL
jgi:hypothetical protein